jgi:rRNA maturation endonuclease Nob1
MKTKSGLKVKLTYKGQRLFEEEIVEVRDSAEMIEAQSRLRRHVSKEVRLEDDEFNRLKTTLTKARTTQISDQKAQVIEAIKHGMQVNLFIPFLIFD